MEINSKRYQDTIIFRDYIRNHIKALKEYENLKKDLAKKYENDRKTYTSSKNEFIKNIIELANNDSD